MEQFHDHHQQPAALETEYLAELDNPVSSEMRNRRFRRGLLWLAFGALTLVMSFGINLLLFQVDRSFITYMYVLTSAGALMLIKGMADVFGF